MERKRLKDVNFFLGMGPNGSLLHWLPCNRSWLLNNLSASNICSPYSRALSFHPGSSVGLHPCWAHISCILHTGKCRPCLPCMCSFHWWSPARRKASRPGLPGSSQPLRASPAVILVHGPVFWIQIRHILSHQSLGGESRVSIQCWGKRQIK